MSFYMEQCSHGRLNKLLVEPLDKELAEVVFMFLEVSVWYKLFCGGRDCSAEGLSPVVRISFIECPVSFDWPVL